MKKTLTIVVGLLTAVALFAVIAVASDDGGSATDTRAETTTTTVAASEPAEAPRDDSDRGGHGREGLDWDREEHESDWLLGKLVSEGVISEDQVSAIEAWFVSQGSGLKDRVDGPEDVLAALVSDGVISQAVADDISERMARFEAMEGGEDKDELGWLLGKLVSEGVISEDQVSAVKAWFVSQGSGLKDRVDGPEDVLAALVSDGVISQAVADDISERMARFEAMEGGEDKDELGWLLGKLVSEGVISEDQVSAIEAWFVSQGSGLKDRVDGPEDVLAALVSDGVISQAVADDISERMARFEAMEGGEDKDELGWLLGKLVSEGVISEDQVSAIEAWFVSQGSGLKDRVDGPEDVLAALVSDGVISQAVADDISERMARFEAMEGGEDKDELGWLLGKLVSEGVISEDQVSAVKAWFVSQGSGLKDRVDGPEDVLAALVSDGVISQAVADDISERVARFEAMEGKGHGDGLPHDIGGG